METINKVNTWTKDGKTKVIINDKYFLPVNMVSTSTGITSNYDVLVGSSVDVTFYKVDEDITETMKCTKDDTIVKSAAFELSPELKQFKLAVAFGAKISLF